MAPGKTKKGITDGGGGGVAFDPGDGGVSSTISVKKASDLTHNVVDWSFMDQVDNYMEGYAIDIEGKVDPYSNWSSDPLEADFQKRYVAEVVQRRWCVSLRTCGRRRGWVGMIQKRLPSATPSATPSGAFAAFESGWVSARGVCLRVLGDCNGHGERSIEVF